MGDRLNVRNVRGELIHKQILPKSFVGNLFDLILVGVQFRFRFLPSNLYIYMCILSNDYETWPQFTLAAQVHTPIVTSNNVPGTHGCDAPTIFPFWQYT